MYRLFAVALAALTLAACTTTNTRLAAAIETPAPGSTVLLVRPDVELALLTAAGMSETRADWTQAGTVNLQSALERSVAASQHRFRSIDPSDAAEGRNGQLMRLHEAVGQSIIAFDYGVYALPTKEGSFDWTLGEGARALADTYDADYALFTYGRGNYASSGRVVTAVAMAALGVGVPMGSQQVFTSLVDLRTGRVIWFNQAQAGPQADIREAEGAEALVTVMMADAPL